MAAFERCLGVRLLDRGRSGAKPTDAGRRILPYARQILASLDATRSETDNSNGLLSGRVRVRSIPSAAVAFLPKVIARFTRDHPNVEVILLQAPSQSAQPLHESLRAQTIHPA